MALYGYREMLDGRIASLVVAADTVEQFIEWCEVVRGQENGNYEELYTSTMMDALVNPIYKGYKHFIQAAYHTSEEQREAFWTEWEIVEVKSLVGRDRQADMLHAKKEEIRVATETPEQAAMTIEERSGLDKFDPWDRRSDEEKAADAEMKKKIEEMRKKGELSGDSFGGADAQRASRDRGTSKDEPGCYSREAALDALKTFLPEGEGDFLDDLSNEELAEELKEAGVPDVKGVFNVGEVPQVVENGNLQVTQIKGSTGSDGVFDISDIVAHKSGGEIDEVAKAAIEQAHADQITEKKGDRKSFSPEDFAAVLRGDGSADAVTNVKGDDRTTRRPAQERPSLSDHAEEARRQYQEEQSREMKRRRTQAEKEADIKAKGERDRGIFRGADLFSDDEPTPFEELPESLQKILDEAGLKRDGILVKNYPYNSELGGRAMLPFGGGEDVRVVGVDNLDVEGTMTMGDAGTMVVKRTDSSRDGYGIYGRRRTVKASEEAEAEIKVDIWLVRVR
jgi:hypothetical protein